MAENLNYNPTTGSICTTNDCATYGILYEWTKARSVCPSTWHLPNKNEWDELMTFVGGISTDGTKLKSSSWNGTDDYGFAALPGGGARSDGIVWSKGKSGNWWSASVNNASVAHDYHAIIDSKVMWMSNASVVGSFLLSVRCIKD